jgi:DNA (cytosine-5)-methyltransferase 1
VSEVVPINPVSRLPQPKVAEFFAGIGLVRAGLEAAGFNVVWSNDIEPAKRDMYVKHFRDEPDDHTFVLGDIADVSASDIPSDIALAWASFPCVDLSLAGWRRGLNGSRSSTFWNFTKIIDGLGSNRHPVVVLENVVGFATSHGGEDLAAAIGELNSLGYSVDTLTLDARRFVPQSRPRLFIVGAQSPPEDERTPNGELRPDWLQGPFGDPVLSTHRAQLPAPPPPLTSGLSQVVERMDEKDERWWDDARTHAFLSSLSPIQAERLATLRKGGRLAYRTAYRRTRQGKPVWEVRADDISGCLRTARGGSSKQAVVRAGLGSVQVRWMTPREYARLMGAGDFYLDEIRINQALFGFGDAVCVPVVSWLAHNYLAPLVRGEMSQQDRPKRVGVNE